MWDPFRRGRFPFRSGGLPFGPGGFPFLRGRGRAGRLDPAVGALPPDAAGYVVIDSELTGLDERRDSILSLGAVWVVDGRIAIGRSFYQEVQPATELSAGSIVVHGITPDDVQGMPGIGGVLERFVRFCGDGVLVGHFIAIDLQFLGKELARHRLPALANPVIDTRILYERLAARLPDGCGIELPHLKDPRLYELARTLGVECRGAHNAFSDAYITAQILLRLLRIAPRCGIETAAEFARTGDPTRRDGHHEGTSLPLT
jgi:DNA polymerase-3 subunit epsilon